MSNCPQVQYAPNQIVTGTIQYVRTQGIGLYVDGYVNAIVSTRSFGQGAEREVFLARFKPGMSFSGRVQAYYPNTRQLVLLPINQVVSVNPLKESKNKKPSSKKAPYVPLEKGSVLIFDMANLLGKIGPHSAVRVMKALKEQLAQQGYQVILLLEVRSLSWCYRNQVCQADQDELKAFVASGEVSLVEGDDAEADLPLVQFVRGLPRSIGVTFDKLSDYKNVYGELVGSTRIRPFTYARADGKLLISVRGLVDAIVIPMCESKEGEHPVEAVKAAVVEETVVETSAAMAVEETVVEATAVEAGEEKAIDEKVVGEPEVEAMEPLPTEVFCPREEKMSASGAVQRRLGVLKHRNDPEAYRELVEVYATMDDEDAVRNSVKYTKLADRVEKRDRERGVRELRKRAEMWRSGLTYDAHVSVRRARQIAVEAHVKAIFADLGQKSA